MMMKVIQDMSETDMQALVTQNVDLRRKSASDLYQSLAADNSKNPILSPDTMKAEMKGENAP